MTYRNVKGTMKQWNCPRTDIPLIVSILLSIVRCQLGNWNEICYLSFNVSYKPLIYMKWPYWVEQLWERVILIYFFIFWLLFLKMSSRAQVRYFLTNFKQRRFSIRPLIYFLKDKNQTKKIVTSSFCYFSKICSEETSHHDTTRQNLLLLLRPNLHL